MNDAGVGAVAGLVATGPMTASMKLMHLSLPREQQYPLPPRQITMGMAETVGVAHRLDESERHTATLAGHFAYGAACGALYGAVERRIPGPGLAKGVGFGLAVWAGSYMGWLPAVGLMPSPAEQPRERTALMIAAHVVWGAALGLMMDAVRSAGERRSGSPAL